MGYPGEPEEPGADKFYTGCSFLVFSLIFLILFFVCAITYGAALIVLVPIYILTFLLCSFAIQELNHQRCGKSLCIISLCLCATVEAPHCFFSGYTSITFSPIRIHDVFSNISPTGRCTPTTCSFGRSTLRLQSRINSFIGLRDTLIMQVSIQELIEQLASETQSIHEPAAQNLVESGAAAAVPLSQICNTPSCFSHRAAAVLKRIGEDAVEPLVQVLQTGDCEVQVHAIIGLHLLNNKKALSPLVAALDSPFAQVRKAATRALWMLRDTEAVEPLIQCLKDEDIEVRESAASALGSIGDSLAVEPLLEMLENPVWRLRQAAAYALGQIGDERALDAVRKHIYDPKKRVRKAVKSALASFHFRRHKTAG
jgi:hypothetical protein